MRERNRRVKQLFDRAFELTGDGRDRFLRAECGTDEALREDVEELLWYAEQSGSSIDLAVEFLRDERNVVPPDQPPPLPEWMAKGATIGKRELIRELGRGAMGVVFLARHTGLGQLRAMKFLHGRHAATPEAIERFLDEGRKHARCKHHNIVTIHDVGVHEGCPFIELEHLSGQTLREWMHSATGDQVDLLAETRSMSAPPATKPTRTTAPPCGMPPGRVAEIMIPMVQALVHAHAQGIVHCDLKPENVMITHDGTVKVLDFGIATLTAGDHAASGRPRPGTPQYMSPEQLAGDIIDHRADIWAVGVILHELITGRRPVPSFLPLLHSEVTNLDMPMPSLAERMPGLGELGSIVDRCLLKSRDARTQTALILLEELQQSRTRNSNMPLAAAPFPGLAAFEESDADRFFGRTDDIGRIVTQLRCKPLIAIAGPSGAGKSSLVRAGVIPTLKRSGEGWKSLTIRPGRHPLAALADQLLLLLDEAPSDKAPSDEAPSGKAPSGSARIQKRSVTRQALVSRLQNEPGLLGARLRAHAGKQLRRVIVFIDQLEELYTVCTDDVERAAFVACIEGAADDSSSPVRVITTIRADFLELLLADSLFAPMIIRGLEFLSPIAREGLREALLEPLNAFGYQFESDELLERMLDALESPVAEQDPTFPAASESPTERSRRSALPLLQFAATRLWTRRDTDRRLLTCESYEALGGVEGALTTHADVVLGNMAEHDRSLAQTILERLVTPERTRAIIGVAELHELGPVESIRRVLARLTEARLIIVEAGTHGNDCQGTVELIHEALIDRWPRLQRWLSENQADRTFLSQLRAAARQWEASGRSRDMLWRGQVARDARRWNERRSRTGYADPHHALGGREESYLIAVVKLEASSRRLGRVALTAAFAMLVAFGAVVSYLALQAEAEASRADREAAHARDEARRARNVSRMAASRELENDPVQVVALLRELEPPVGVAEWSALARRALRAGTSRAVLRHDDAVLTAHYSPDGHHVLTASRDGVVQIWNADGSGQPRPVTRHPGVHMALFSPDGQRVVTTSGKTARVWRADGSGELAVLRGHDALVTVAMFSPDGQRIVSASMDGTARVWSSDGTGHPFVFRGHQSKLITVAFSPDGRRIASASQDKTARIWNADGSGTPTVLAVGELVLSAVFDPDGTRVLTTSLDGVGRIWNADGQGTPRQLQYPGSTIRFGNFSPDGRLIVTSSEDLSIRLWDAETLRQLAVLRGHTGVVFAPPFFSPDSTQLVTASHDGTARVWQVDAILRSPILRGHNGRVRAAFSPDGVQIASVGDRTMRLWSADGQPVRLAHGHTALVQSVAFSPDGAHIVTASRDRTVRLWNADGSGHRVFKGHEEAVYHASFNRDGSCIVSASADDTAVIWTIDGSSRPRILRGHDGDVTSAAFSPDGTLVATASADRTIRIWHANESVTILRGHSEEVRSVDFSPDGARIATASADGTIRIWSVDDARQLMVLRGHEAAVNMVVFSPDGARIASASNDRTVRVWSADGSGEPVILHGHQNRVVSVRFNRVGRRLVTGSDSGSVRIWDDLEPLELGSPRLWAATSYCMSVTLRKRLLGVSEDLAQENRETCKRRVREARVSE